MAQAVDFVIPRCGQNLWIDREFETNYSETKKRNIPRGSYWYYDNRIDPRRQAELWLKTLNGDFGEIGLWCDFEDRFSGKWNKWQDWKTFIQVLLIDVPKEKIGIYTAYYYWLENTVQKGIPPSEMQWFGRFPLWVANYKVNSPLVPKPWTNWTLWQYTDKGNAAAVGIVDSKSVDENWYNGTKDEMYQFFNIGDQPPAPPEPEVPQEEYIEIRSVNSKGEPIGQATRYKKV